MATTDRPRILFEPGRVRVSARGVGGIKSGGGPGSGRGGRGGGGAGHGRGHGLGNVGVLVSAFGAIASARGQVVPSPQVAGALTLLSTTTLSVAGTFDVSGISGSYNDLVIVLVARMSDASVSNIDSVGLRFNNDAGATQYVYESISGNVAAAAASGSNGTTRALVAQALPNTQAAAGFFGCVEIEVPGYASTSWNKVGISRSFGFGSTTNRWTDANGFQWASTAAITRVQLFGLTTANMEAGSTLRIYGRL